jgi:hypothetical protein
MKSIIDKKVESPTPGFIAVIFEGKAISCIGPATIRENPRMFPWLLN